MLELNDLIRLMKTAKILKDIDKYKEEIAILIPPVRIMFNFDQQNTAHNLDLWEHSIYTSILLPRNMDDGMLYLASLIHDIGKPECQCKGKKEGDCNMHYYSHSKRSAEIVREILIDWNNRGIQLTEDDKRRLLYYVEYHDDYVDLQLKHLHRHLEIASLEEFQHLMLLQVADAKAHAQIPLVVQRIKICEQLAGEYAVKMHQSILFEDQEKD